MKGKTILSIADKSSNAEKEIRGDPPVKESCGDVGEAAHENEPRLSLSCQW